MIREICQWALRSLVVCATAVILQTASLTVLDHNAQAAPRLPRSVPANVDQETKILSIKKLLRRPLRYDYRPVMTTGFLVRHESHYLLFPKIEDYEEWKVDLAIRVMNLPKNVARDWEKFERAYVHLAGQFQSPCGGRRAKEKTPISARTLGRTGPFSLSVCDDSDLDAPHLAKVVFAEFISQHSVEIDKKHPHYWREFEWKGLLWGQRGKINRAAGGFFDAVIHRNYDLIMGYFGPNAPVRLKDDLTDPQSVISRRLYDGENSISQVWQQVTMPTLKLGTIKKSKRSSDESPYAFACVCKKLMCLGNWQPTRYGAAADVDPLLCLAMEKGQNGWHVDYYPFLTPDRHYNGLAW